MSDFEIYPFPDPPESTISAREESQQYKYDIGDVFVSVHDDDMWVFITGYHSLGEEYNVYYVETQRGETITTEENLSRIFRRTDEYIGDII